MTSTNLIYNGDFSKGTYGWSAVYSISVDSGVVTVKGDLLNSFYIPCANGNTYRLEFDVKNVESDGNQWLLALYPYDEYKRFIDVNKTLCYNTPSRTTLASVLNDGDTTVSLTSSSGWDTGSTHYLKQIGICDNQAYQYNRCTKNAHYSSISGNTLTLTEAWSQGTVPVGTRVANFADGNTYYYPWGISSLSDSWTHVSVDFQGGDNVRYSTQYIKFCTLGYTRTYQMKNISLTNLTTLQTCSAKQVDCSININKNGIVVGEIHEATAKVRYIKDSINGSNANSGNHWVEIQAFDTIGNNVAFNKTAKTADNVERPVLTDGNIDSEQWQEGGSSSPVTVDLGAIYDVKSLKIWHYWADGRTYYDNVVSISEDGTNWRVVYSGEHQETSSGFEIKLSPARTDFNANGYISTNEIKEF